MTSLDSSIRSVQERSHARAATPTRVREAAARAAAARAARPLPHAAARGAALFFGVFSLLNLIGELRSPGFDENIWWLDLRPLPATPATILLGVAGALLVWWAVRPAGARWRRVATLVALTGLTIVALRNGIAFYRVWDAGQIQPRVPLPLSFLFAAALLFIAGAAARPAPAGRRRETALMIAAVVLACGVLFPVAQQEFFGKTTYERHVQVAVVFGAQVHSDGHPSISLEDRVRTAADLYTAGLAERLLMSGAQGANEPVNETAKMKQLAVGFGVPAAAIDVDPAGFNTDATVRDTVPALAAAGYRSVAVVSDFFHLPRIKLAYQRAGLDVTTVPSKARRIPQTAALVTREIPAFWVYYLRAVLR